MKAMTETALRGYILICKVPIEAKTESWSRIVSHWFRLSAPSHLTEKGLSGLHMTVPL